MCSFITCVSNRDLFNNSRTYLRIYASTGFSTKIASKVAAQVLVLYFGSKRIRICMCSHCALLKQYLFSYKR